jgi:hypothetical protein
MHWKVRLDGEEGVLRQLAEENTTPAAQVTRDGVEWFLESTEFQYFTDHLEVKEKAGAILGSLLAAGSVPPQTSIALGAIYRMHYDNSKTVYK